MVSVAVRRALAALATTTVIALPAAGARPSAVAASPPDQSSARSYLTVMTRNLDEGTDFKYFIAAAQGLIPFSTAVATTYAEVLASDVCGRAARIADEIAATDPDLVSVQEAAVWTGPLPGNCPGAANATTIDAGAALMHRLAELGANYTVVAQLDEFNSSVIAPLLPGLSFLDRDMVLARVKPAGGLSLSNVIASNFRTILPLPLTPDLSVPILRGWISVDATVNGRTARLIATHLESFYEPVQFAQAAEIALGPANTTLPVVLAGDLNTGPGSDQTDTYDWLTGAAGFTDTWSVTRPNDPGFTDGYYSEDPLTPSPSGPTERIDLVLVRGMDVASSPKDYLTGTVAPPSDHAGVVAKLRLTS